MADKEELTVQNTDEKQKPVKAKTKKPNFIVRWAKSISRYCREMKSELKKVTWPSKNQVIRNTLVVLLVVLIVGVLIWIFDWLAAAVIKALINLF